MNIEHSTIANRLQGHPNLFDCSSSEFSTSNGRLALHDRVGWKEDAEHSEQSHYDASNVPLLHKDYDGKFDLEKFMLIPMLLVVHAAITKGPASAWALKNKTAPPKAQSVTNLWCLKKTTPGMIASSAIWVNDMFLPVGSTTGIEWWLDFDFYLQYLSEGLQKWKPSVLKIFCVWDKVFYPNDELDMCWV
ncbi:hypothetical protein BT96DRAFT_821759 [Gymnopus androsaceus JB14]|uniref:Uncharacterized protein n=1 Tax=Gymnopus androsaceus JB14 TaxID=1447944 RepID=A0A6A4HKU3_9AGAR|nr:hypothetical protein BT96DRAFT_821759 [Gymnopus androsaceus JB14]